MKTSTVFGRIRERQGPERVENSENQWKSGGGVVGRGGTPGTPDHGCRVGKGDYLLPPATPPTHTPPGWCDGMALPAQPAARTGSPGFFRLGPERAVVELTGRPRNRCFQNRRFWKNLHAGILTFRLHRSSSKTTVFHCFSPFSDPYWPHF